jgi:hypothetical protein
MAAAEQHQQQPQQQRVVGNWILEGELGRGSFAVVWRARHATSGAPAAVKEINTDKLNKKLQESLASEVAVLSQTKHHNVVGLLDLLKVRGAGGARRIGARGRSRAWSCHFGDVCLLRTARSADLPHTVGAAARHAYRSRSIHRIIPVHTAWQRALPASLPPTDPHPTPPQKNNRTAAASTSSSSTAPAATWAATSAATAASPRRRRATSWCSWPRGSRSCGGTTSST